MKKRFYYYTDIGKICIVENSKKIVNIYITDEDSFEKVEIEETPLIKMTVNQLIEYFSGERTSFNVDIELQGTEFQKKYG